jgi:hypothetical protein
MSLRDYFAAKIFASYRAAGDGRNGLALAAIAYQDADAMLLQREK